METQPIKQDSPSTASAPAILRGAATVFTFLGRDCRLRAGSRAKRHQSAPVMAAFSGARSHPLAEWTLGAHAADSLSPDHPVIKKWEYNAYFRQKSHVSLCDLRSVRESDLKMALDNYFFLDLGGARADPVFLILSSSSVNRIVTNDEAIDDATEAGQMIVPIVEAGYPGDLPLAEITDVLIVDIDRPPPSPFVRVLQHLCGTEDTHAAGRGRR